METNKHNNNSLRDFLKFFIKFIVLFLFFYIGTEIMNGVSIQGGYYSQFVSKYLDYISLLKRLLLNNTKILLSLFDIETYQPGNFIIRIKDGMGGRIADGCVGYGVYSFWIAYVLANLFSFKRKIVMIIIGLIILWSINVTRISLLLVALNKQWSMPLGLNHHTWFTIVSYIAIFVMIYIFEKKSIVTTEN